MNLYDLAIIGSGPGGYAAALYASRHKLKACLIEQGSIGGTCLNRGCIPTKALLNTASIFTTIKNSSVFGVDTDGCRVDFPKAIARKDEVVTRLRTGLETLFRAAAVEIVRGTASIAAPDTIKVDGSSDIKAGHIIIAAGSIPAVPADMTIDGKRILTSDEVLNIKTIPKELMVIGGGVIGCEFATLFNALGVKVKIVEMTDRLVPTMSREISKKLELVFKKKGIDVFTSAKADPRAAAEMVLVAVGRSPNTARLGLEKIGIKTERGRIATDEGLRTAVKNIYAIGDCVSGPQLAHKASYDALLACDNIMGRERRRDYSNVPNCVWTDPEIASVGMTEDEAKAKSPDVKAAKFPYLASGKAYLAGKTDGFVKIIGDPAGNILGCEIFGAGACDLIAEAALAGSAGVNIKDWAKVVHAHPTLSEMFQEAAHIFCGTPIHGI